jgi:hypothetical protein
VDTKFLCRLGDGTYARVSDGHTERPRLRMAKADGEDAVSVKEKEAV